jgi:hypothetical protein
VAERAAVIESGVDDLVNIFSGLGKVWGEAQAEQADKRAKDAARAAAEAKVTAAAEARMAAEAKLADAEAGGSS